MKKKIDVPDSYYDDEEFLVDDFDESIIIGILGPNATSEQILKYELCRQISQRVRERSLSNHEAGKITGLDASDISRLNNFHIDRFTIDRLIKIFCMLENKSTVWKSIARISSYIAKGA